MISRPKEKKNTIVLWNCKSYISKSERTKYAVEKFTIKKKKSQIKKKKEKNIYIRVTHKPKLRNFNDWI